MRALIRKQADAVPAHAGVFGGDVVAEPVAAEHVVLGLRDVGCRNAGAHRREAGIERLLKDAEALHLQLARLADHERAADLRVIALDAGRELGGDEIARLENLAGGGRHAAHLAAAHADDHEVFRNAFRPEETFDLGDQLIVLAAGPRRGPEDLIAPVRELSRTANVDMLLRAFAHQQWRDELAAIEQTEPLGVAHKSVGQQVIGRRRKASVAAPEQMVARGSDEIMGLHDLVGCLRAGALGLGGIVQDQRDRAVPLEQGESLAFDDAEVGGVTQRVGVPVVAVEQEAVDVGGRHGGPQIIDAGTIGGRMGRGVATHHTSP